MAESLDPATTTSAVARRYGLHPSQLFVWRQQLAAAAGRGAPGFVPVVVAEDGPAVVRVGAERDLDPAHRLGRSTSARAWTGWRPWCSVGVV